jgi:hypothetical protein
VVNGTPQPFFAIELTNDNKKRMEEVYQIGLRRGKLVWWVCEQMATKAILN